MRRSCIAVTGPVEGARTHRRKPERRNGLEIAPFWAMEEPILVGPPALLELLVEHVLERLAERVSSEQWVA
jgi:hypothetical protein